MSIDIFETYFKERKSQRQIAEELGIKQLDVSNTIRKKLREIGEPDSLYKIKPEDVPRILKKYSRKKKI